MLRFNPSDAAKADQAQMNIEARAYLNSTDWYYMRQLGAGMDAKPVPAEIMADRQLARDSVVED